MVGERAELVVHEQPANDMPAYERLLGDATRGDASLFVRQDSVEAAWRVLDPVLGNVTPVHEYEPNTWGPVQVADTIEPEGGWHDPKPFQPRLVAPLSRTGVEMIRNDRAS